MSNQNYRIMKVAIGDMIAHVQRKSDKDEIYITIDKQDFDQWLADNNRLEIGKAYSSDDEAAHVEMMPITLNDYYSHAIDVNDSAIIKDVSDYLLNDELRLLDIELQFAFDDAIACAKKGIEDAKLGIEAINNLNVETLRLKMQLFHSLSKRYGKQQTINQFNQIKTN